MFRQLYIVDAVRRGLALATPELAEIISECPDAGNEQWPWFPRWILETAAALAEAGYPPDQIRSLFAGGRDRVLAELAELVRAGKRTAVLSSRNPYERSPIDRLTERAMRDSLLAHSAKCPRCQRGQGCFPAAQLVEELALLFPEERRGQPRTGASGGRA